MRFALLLLPFATSWLGAQEIKYIDLTALPQRTALRHPPAPQPDCPEGKSCVASGHAGIAVGDGGPDRRDPHALGVYLLGVAPIDIDPAEPFEAEFRVMNTGLAPIEVPVWPNLSDLQPLDESATFAYFSLSLVARVVADPPAAGAYPVGYVELYGAADQEGSVLTLKPGEWIRVKATIKLGSGLPDAGSGGLRGEFWLRHATYHPDAGGSSTVLMNLYPNATPTPAIPVRFHHGPRQPTP